MSNSTEKQTNAFALGGARSPFYQATNPPLGIDLIGYLITIGKNNSAPTFACIAGKRGSGKSQAAA
ncbi:MAG: hypothetical protein ACK5YR_07570 [Pirellula sp.]|jgi:hypothetical protein